MHAGIVSVELFTESLGIRCSSQRHTGYEDRLGSLRVSSLHCVLDFTRFTIKCQHKRVLLPIRILFSKPNTRGRNLYLSMGLLFLCRVVLWVSCLSTPSCLLSRTTVAPVAQFDGATSRFGVLCSSRRHSLSVGLSPTTPAGSAHNPHPVHGKTTRRGRMSAEEVFPLFMQDTLIPQGPSDYTRKLKTVLSRFRGSFSTPNGRSGI